MHAPASIADFDMVPVADAAAELYPCCASRRWIGELVRGRPYRNLAALHAASDAALSRLQWADVEEALAAHPRIGERASGDGVEAAWSRQEQSGGGDSPALRDGNAAYEGRFGHVFLICATGLSADDVLAALRARLGNPVDVERDVVRAELAKIVRLRLAKAFRS